MRRRTLLAFLTGCVTLLLIFVLSEVGLRLAGMGPWVYAGSPNEESMHEFDAVLGWANRPGVYEIPPYVPGGAAIQVTILEDGRRVTRRDAGESSPVARWAGELVVVGGSFTQGWAISDHETFAWKLQQRFPQLDVRNYGTGAYGTLQSLLVLERRLPEFENPVAVVYGFLEDHEKRNVAPASWMEGLARWASRGHVHVPYATVDPAGRLVRHAPERHLALPLRDRSATVTLLERLYMRISDGVGAGSRFRQRRSVTERLLVEMNGLVGARGASFAVVILGASQATAEHYKAFLARHDVRAIDCGHDFRVPPQMTVPGEGHPDGAMNTIWAQCLSPWVADALARRGS